MTRTTLTLTITLIALNCCAQTSLQQRRNSLDSLLDGRTHRLVSSEILDSLLVDNMYKISGTNIKEGKSAASAATIDDKSATVNFSFKPSRRLFFVQPTVAATSSNGFVDVFSSGKYNKAFSGGLTFQRFLYSKIALPGSQYNTIRNQLHNKLRIVRRQYIDIIDDKINPWKMLIDSVRQLYKQNEAVFASIQSNRTLSEAELSTGNAASEVGNFYRYVNKLISEGVLDSKDIELDPVLIVEKLESVQRKGIDDIFWTKMLKETDSLQYHVKAAPVIKWLSWGVQYNNQAQPILDTSKPGKPATFYNEYISGKISFNRLSIRPSGSGLYWSPNLTFSNSRNFKDEDKKTANFTSQVSIGSSSAQRIDSTISYFENVQSRKFVWAFEMPFLWYWKSSKLGLDIAVHVGGNDPKGDNVGGRIGLYIPVGTSGESILSVEPLLRIQKLFETSSQTFFKDNIAFGFNVSVSVPAFFNTK